jgi:hypothetical protein
MHGRQTANQLRVNRELIETKLDIVNKNPMVTSRFFIVVGAGRPPRQPAGRRRYLDASSIEAFSWAIAQSIFSGVMIAGGAMSRWSPEVPSTHPCMG